jgi:hypothetical protein
MSRRPGRRTSHSSAADTRLPSPGRLARHGAARDEASRGAGSSSHCFGSVPRALGWPPRCSPLRRPTRQSQVLQNCAHPGGCPQLRQHPAPATTPHSAEHLQRQHTAQHSRTVQAARLLLRPLLLPRAHQRALLLRPRLLPPRGSMITEESFMDLATKLLEEQMGITEQLPLPLDEKK